MKPRNSAMTLAELLIAMMLCSLLLVIIWPLFGQARQNSMALKCQANLRQIAAAGFLYATDSGGNLPDRGMWGHFSGGPWSLLPYLGLPQLTGSSSGIHDVLSCPAVQASPFRTYYTGRRTYSINQYATGSDNSSANARGTWESQVKSRDVPLRISNVHSPSRQAFFMDGTTLLEGEGYRYSAFQTPDRLEPASEDTSSSWRTPFAHQGKIQVVFLDGHVRMISAEEAMEELVGPTNPSVSQAHTSPRSRPFWGAGK